MMLYVPDRVSADEAFPFKDNEVVKIRVDGDRVIQERAEWWELLNWEKLPDAYSKLPGPVKEQIEKRQKSRKQ